MSYTEKNSSLIKPELSFLFLSDVHLGAFPEEQNRLLEDELVELVSYCEEKKLQIIILGDLFDYWMEYPDCHPPVGEKLLHRFQQYHHKTGRRTLYITGNHDNWTRGYLDSLGFDIEHEYRIIETREISFMVMHGDGLQDAAMNFPRSLMNRILRNSYFVYIYQTLLPPRWGWQLMKLFSQNRKDNPDNAKNCNIRHSIDSWAKNRVSSDPSIQAIIYGHHHRPFLNSQNGNTCMNCGSFAGDKTVGLYTNKKFRIVNWNAADKMLITS